jgi:hypothetical protein
MAHVVRVSRSRSRASARRWRRRGRRAQVAAVATILGLLLVVTFIANFLSTTLPNTMAQNDLQHGVQVQNQVAQLSALIQETVEAGAVSAQISQPISLGSAAAPPFAGQDGSTVNALPNGTSLSVHFALVGPLRLPNGGVPNTGSFTSHCTGTLTGINCTGKSDLTWNFTAGNSTQYHVNGNGQLSVAANFTTNNSLIAVGSVGGASDIVSVFGSNDTVYVNATGGAALGFVLVGNDDTVFLSCTGGGSITIYLVGNRDSISTSTQGGGAVTMVAYGLSDHFTDAGSPATVYYIGFNIENPNGALCPYANLANTDTVSGVGGTVTYNNTNAGNLNTTSGGWNIRYNNPTPSACPYVVTAVISQTPAGTGFIVGLHNTYAPSAEVAYDEGAVVYAQPGGLPVFIVPPRISYGNGVLQLFIPQFANAVSAEAGVGTADASLRLLAANHFTFPSNGFTLGNNTPVTVTVVTPYAAAWYAYFLSVPSLAPFATCSGAHNVCTALYGSGGPLGTVKLVLPASGIRLDFLIGLYSFSLS